MNPIGFGPFQWRHEGRECPVRSIVLVIMGLLGAAVLSQGPEYAQQYRQNLDGEVRALTSQVTSYQSRAVLAGVTVDDWIDASSSEEDRGHRRETVVRHEALSEHQGAMAEAGPFNRLIVLAQGYDQTVASAAFAAFEPALPVTLEGAAHAGVGFVIGWIIGLLLLSGLAVFGIGRRRQSA